MITIKPFILNFLPIQVLSITKALVDWFVFPVRMFSCRFHFLRSTQKSKSNWKFIIIVHCGKTIETHVERNMIFGLKFVVYIGLDLWYFHAGFLIFYKDWSYKWYCFVNYYMKQDDEGRFCHSLCMDKMK